MQFVIKSEKANLAFRVVVNATEKTVTHIVTHNESENNSVEFDYYGLNSDSTLKEIVDSVIEGFNESETRGGDDWAFSFDFINLQIEVFSEKIRENYICDSVEFTPESADDYGRIEITYSFNMDYADKVLGYTLEEWQEDAPETFELKSIISIQFENGIITDYEQTGSLADCDYSRKFGSDSIEGFEFDHNIKHRGEMIIDYLAEFASELREKKYEGSEEFEILFDDETHPQNAYNNTYVKIAKRNDHIFVSVSTNHVAHNESDYNGRSEWVRLEKYAESHECSFEDEFSEQFPEIIEILKNN